MTPAEHRAAAERLLEKAKTMRTGELTELEHEGGPRRLYGELHRIAQVHALLALAPATAAPPPAKPKPAQRVEVFDVELNHLAVYASNPLGGIVLHYPMADWSTLLDDPAQVRLLADTLTAHADRMENRT